VRPNGLIGLPFGLCDADLMDFIEKRSEASRDWDGSADVMLSRCRALQDHGGQV
jgi:hypothetical protein